MLKRIKVGEEALVAAESCCCTAKNRKKWVEEHDLFVGTDGRAYALVDSAKEVYFMDAITGALFQFGRTFSGSRVVPQFTRNRKRAEQILIDTFMKAACR